MNRLNNRGFIKAAFSIISILCVFMVVSLFVIEYQTSSREARWQRLNQNLLQIEYYDEVLTMSARMTASTGDLSYQERYDSNVAILDTIIQSTYLLLSSSRFQDDLHVTSDANHKLVAMETKAFELVHQNKNAEALQLLESFDYLTEKAIYWDALQCAIRDLENENAEKQEGLERFSLFLKLCSALLLGLVLWIALKFYKSQRDAEKAAAQTEALKVVLTTVSDLVGNAFNHLLLVKMKVDQNPDFTDEERKIFSDAIYGTTAKLREMREMREFKVRISPGGNVLDLK